MSGDVIQDRINLLEQYLSLSIVHPEWLVSPSATQEWLEEEIAQLECEQLAEIENSRLAGRLLLENNKNLIIPIVPQWGGAINGGNLL